VKQTDRRQALIPEGMSLRIRLETRLATKTNREGDQFSARVVEPRAYVAQDCQPLVGALIVLIQKVNSESHSYHK
jgi:hypothetical protein